jgi:hypothetical protein
MDSAQLLQDIPVKGMMEVLIRVIGPNFKTAVLIFSGYHPLSVKVEQIKIGN